MPKITYSNEKKTLLVDSETQQSLLDISLAHNIPHYHACNGHARCSTCRVRVMKGVENLPPRNAAEQRIAEKKGWGDDIRLACQTIVTEDVDIRPLVTDDEDVDLVYAESNKANNGYEKSLAVMFCDIAHFSEFTSHNLPYDVIHLLNRYYKELCSPILLNHGYIDKYMGDGIMVLFGIEHNTPKESCDAAVRAALGMLTRIKILNRYTEKHFDHKFDIRIGIHYGSVIVGEIGHPCKRQLTVLGESVNIASRIETANKEFGSQLLISEAVYQYLKNDIDSVYHSDVQLRGQQNDHHLYEVKQCFDKEKVLLLQNSFAYLDNKQKLFTRTFYKKFLSSSEEIKAAFKHVNMTRQQTMLYQAIELGIKYISQPNCLTTQNKLRELGLRHQQDYQTDDTHYAIFTCVFLETLMIHLAENWTAELAEIWEQMLVKMIAMMHDIPAK